MMDVCFIIGGNVNLNNFNYKDMIVVGIDRGAYLALQSNIKLDYAVGDFDSITSDELKQLEDYTTVIKLNPIKDETDTLYALRMFKDYDNLYLLGGITGPRIDHFVANLKLFYEFPNLKIIDNNTLIMECKSGLNLPKDEYKFYSFFALEDVSNLTMTGFKYPLTDFYLKHSNPLCVSNEIEEEGNVSFSKGRLLLFKTKE